MFDKSKYIPRLIDDMVDLYLSTFGAVCLEGPKWCGNTWTSQLHSKSAFFVGSPKDNFANRQLARLEVSKALEGKAPHLIDEWQEVGSIWDAVRAEVDESNEVGRFILTGSATPQQKGVLHSGTGRIACLKMHPMSLYELGLSHALVSFEDVCDGKEIGVQNSMSPSLEELIGFVIAEIGRAHV